MFSMSARVGICVKFRVTPRVGLTLKLGMKLISSQIQGQRRAMLWFQFGVTEELKSRFGFMGRIKVRVKERDQAWVRIRVNVIVRFRVRVHV